ncbi:MAG: DNA photolyase [candidate division KSB1 bacterium]|nr:DNA photolyase [candidate division KSB1 bacterium]
MTQTAKKFTPKRIFIEKSVAETEFTRRILDQFKVAHKHINDANALLTRSAISRRPHLWKKSLLLARQRGPFMRLCPGTQKHICCLYHNLDVAAGCNLGCTYCFLQGYLNTPLITLYANLNDMYTELEDKIAKNPKRFFRVGTGELSDSLTFDDFTCLSRELVEWFSEKSNAIIELKSKNTHIENVLDLKHNGRSVISWSMNSQAMANSEESSATSRNERLRAAKAVQDAGYRIGFHFDPMIHHSDWQTGYRETVDKIFKVIKPETIAWISLGALRYPAGFDSVIRKNHPESRIVLGELVPGLDQKLRYFKKIRIDMFKHMYSWIKSCSPDVFVYLCMEREEIWRRAFGWSPRNSAELKTLLDARVKP